MRLICATVPLAGLFGLMFNASTAHAQQSEDLLPEAIEADSERAEVTLVAVGDILLSRYVGQKMDEAEDPLLPFRNVDRILSEADLTFGNLESPIVDSEIPIRKGVVFRCLPRWISGVVTAGFDVLSTANNHALDQGIENLEYTVDLLASKGIAAVGTGKDLAQAHRGAVLEVQGLRVGFLGYSYAAFNDGGEKTHEQIATWHDLGQLHDDIVQMNDRSDVTVVSIHAGIEYQLEPTRRQREFARAAIEAGADVVIGHHPHCIEPIETYKNRPIFYSLGNFIFDQSRSITRRALMVRLRLVRGGVSEAELIPIAIEDRCCPRLLHGAEKKEALKLLGLESEVMTFRLSEEIDERLEISSGDSRIQVH